MIIYFSDCPLGRNIRLYRQRMYISCEKLARLAGMDCRYLHLIEKGLLRDIDYDHLKALCAILGTTHEKLMGEGMRTIT